MNKTQDTVARTLIVVGLVLQIAIITMIVYACTVIYSLTVVVSEIEQPVVHYYIPTLEVEEEKVKPETKKETKVLTEKEKIKNFIAEVSKLYNVDPYLIESMVYHESSYKPRLKTGSCYGLMQINPKWHKDRMKRLGVTNLYDPYENILVGVDYINELIMQNQDTRLALMMYNMNHKTALENYKSGNISYYARSVIKFADTLRKGE